MSDDLSRRRGRLIAERRTLDEIRADIRQWRNACPQCGTPMNRHSLAQLDACALGEQNQPKQGA